MSAAHVFVTVIVSLTVAAFIAACAGMVDLTAALTTSLFLTFSLGVLLHARAVAGEVDHG